MHGHANACPGRGDHVAGLHGGCVRAFPRVDGGVEVPRRVGHLSEEGEIVGIEHAVGIGSCEETEGLAPLTPRSGLPSPVDGSFSRASGHRIGLDDVQA